MTMKHTYPNIIVRWADHFGTHTNESYELEDIIGMMKPCIRETTGYLVAENKRVLAIAGTIEEDGSVTDVNFLMKRGVIYRSDKA